MGHEQTRAREVVTVVVMRVPIARVVHDDLTTYLRAISLGVKWSELNEMVPS